jgi:peptidylprolyl isomerase
VREAGVRGLIAIVAAAAALQAVAVGAAEAPAKPADYRTISPDDLLVVDTNKGRILVELSPIAAPAHVERLRTLARRHFYDGQTFFRVIDDFMAQTGDPTNTGEGGSTLPDLKAEFSFRRGAGEAFVKAAKVDDQIVGFIGALPVGTQPDDLMLMTADSKVTAWPLFCPGVLGMARNANEDSANSQFFFMRAAYPTLDRKYTGFARVVSGEEVVRAIKTGEPVQEPRDKMLKVRLASDLPEAERPKVQILDTRSAAFAALLESERAKAGADFSICDVSIPVIVQ